MKCDKNMMLLYAVTDQSWVGKQSLYEQIECALKGGVTCIQLREKEMDYETFLNEAIQIASLCKQYQVPLFINDNVDVAIQCHADGIHVGQDDMSVKEVRKHVGEDMIIGLSVHSVEEALLAKADGADYLGVGSMFSTSTKLDVDILDKEVLKEICECTDLPVVAIGGINKNNMEELKGTKIDGVALVSAIFASEDIEKECQILKELAKKVVYTC